MKKITKILLISLVFMAGCTYGTFKPGMTEWDYKMYHDGWTLECEEYGCYYKKRGADMTGADFYSYVLRKFLRTDKSTEAYEAMTDTISLMQIKFKSDTYSEEAYVAGISSLGEYQMALPSDFGHIIGTVSVTDTASDDEYANLNKISKQEYDAKYTDRSLTSTGNINLAVPRDFCVYAGQLYVGPVPDLTTYRYQINYTTENATEIASDTDPVPFTSELRHRNVLRNGVLFELHDGLENFEEAAYYKQLFLDGLNDIIKQEAGNRADSSNIAYNGI